MSQTDQTIQKAQEAVYLVGSEIFLPTVIENFSKEVVRDLKKEIFNFFKHEDNQHKLVTLNFGNHQNVPKHFFEMFFGDKQIKEAKKGYKFILTNVNYQHRHELNLIENW